MGLLALVSILLFGIILMFAMVENEKPGFATLSLIALAVTLSIFADVNLLAFTIHHPLQVLTGLGVYFLAGTLWSVAKWWFFVRSQAHEYYKCRADFLVQKGLPANTVFNPQLLEEFHKGTVRDSNYPGGYSATSYGSMRLERLRKRPSVRANKSRILIWMMFWPWSATWTIINDPVKKLFKEIFNCIKSVYESVANSVYKDIDPQ